MSAPAISDDDWLDGEARLILARRLDRERLSLIEAPALQALELVGNGAAPGRLDRPPDQFVHSFVWRDPATLPRRQWLYGGHLIRKFVSATFAPGGVGKSALKLCEGMAMASGKPLLGILPRQRLRVGYWNGEDPLEETERRALATAILHGLGPADMEDWLYLGSGRESELVIAEQTGSGAVILAPNVDAVVATIRSLRLDVVIIDPFVSSHRVTENDNNAIDLVVKRWGRIAELTNTAIELVHHTRKTNGAETTVEDGRGAVALLNAVRSAEVLNPMTKEERERAGVKPGEVYFKVENGKANLAPPSKGANWYQIVSVDLGNAADGQVSDSVGAVRCWSWPDPFDGVSTSDLLAVQDKIAAGQWRADVQATEWAGRAVAEVLSLDLDDKANKRKVKGLLATWVETGALRRVMAADKTRQNRPMIVVGAWAGNEAKHQCTTLHHLVEETGAEPICNTAPPAPPPLGRCSGGGAVSPPSGDQSGEPPARPRARRPGDAGGGGG